MNPFKGSRPYDVDKDGVVIDPRRYQAEWDQYLRRCFDGNFRTILKMDVLERYLDGGYIDVHTDYLYLGVLEKYVPLLYYAIASHATLPVLCALLDRGADTQSWMEKLMDGGAEMSWVSPMSLAIRVGNHVAIGELLNRGVDPLAPCWKCTFTSGGGSTKLRDRPRKTLDALRYAVDMSQPDSVAMLLRHHRLPTSALAPHIGYLQDALRQQPLSPSRWTFKSSLHAFTTANDTYARFEAAECVLLITCKGMRGAWRDVGPMIARGIVAGWADDTWYWEEEEEEERREPVSKKIKL